MRRTHRRPPAGRSSRASAAANARAISEAKRRAPASSGAPPLNVESSRAVCRSRLALPPRARASSASSAATAFGSRRAARSTSRHMTLPEPSQIELSGASRYSRGSGAFLDVAVAAEHFHRLGDERRARACRASTCAAGVDDAREQRLLPRRRRRPRSVRASRSAEHDGGFGFEREVGQHVLHQRLLGQRATERAAVPRMVQRLRTARRARCRRCRSRNRAACAAPSRGSSGCRALPRRAASRRRRRTRLRTTRSSDCRACPSVAACGSRCARHRAGSAAGRSTTGRLRSPAPAPGARRTSAPRKTTCARVEPRIALARRPATAARVVLARTSEPPCSRSCPCRSARRASCCDRQRARIVFARQDLRQPRRRSQDARRVPAQQPAPTA